MTGLEFCAHPPLKSRTYRSEYVFMCVHASWNAALSGDRCQCAQSRGKSAPWGKGVPGSVLLTGRSSARIIGRMSEPSCAVPACTASRVPGTSFCPGHGPNPTGKAPRVEVGTSSDARNIVCPHCQSAGGVKRKQVKVKRGISGGKATGAVLTAGFSLLATGLSRKETVTEMHCGRCGTTWHVA